MKNVKNKLKERGASEDEIKEFEKGAQAYAKKLVGDKEFDKKYEFLIGEKMDPDGMYAQLECFVRNCSLTQGTRVVLLNYRDDGVTPYVIVWKHGLTEMKV